MTDFRPLSRGSFFNAEIDALNAKMDAIMFSSPFSGTFFQSSDGLLPSNRLLACVFVPFLGDLFSIGKHIKELRFTPLVFVPFLGDFLSIRNSYVDEETA